MTHKEAMILVEDINRVRKNHKDQWWYYHDKVFNIKLKGFNTWIQRIERKNYIDGSPMEMSVKQFKEWLTDWLVGTA